MDGWLDDRTAGWMDCFHEWMDDGNIGRLNGRIEEWND